MPSTYTTNTGIEKPASGEQSGSWGVTVNTNMDIIDRNLNGSVSIALSGTTSTLTTNDGSLSNGHYKVLKFTGILAATHTVTVDPADAQKIYMVHNATNQTVTFTQGTGVSDANVLAGEFGTIYADGSDECHNLTVLQSIPTAVQDELDVITADDWVTNARIATDAVNADSIAAGAVGTSEIADDSVTNAKIASDAVTEDSIAANAVNTTELAASAVTTAKIADNAITAAKIADNSVGASEIAENSVGASELNVSGDGTTSQFLRSDADGSFTWAVPTDTTYTADGNYGMTLSGTAFRLENDRRRNSSTEDVWTGNTHDYVHFDADIGMRFYTNNGEDMRLTDAGVLHVDNDIVAFSSVIPSDQRLKENIQPINDALNIVSQITGYTFNYKKDGRASAGVIAQELEQVLPSAVTERDAVFDDDGETYKTVQYDQLHAVLIEAIKELKAKVEALENGD